MWVCVQQILLENCVCERFLIFFRLRRVRFCCEILLENRVRERLKYYSNLYEMGLRAKIFFACGALKAAPPLSPLSKTLFAKKHIPFLQLFGAGPHRRVSDSADQAR